MENKEKYPASSSTNYPSYIKNTDLLQNLAKAELFTVFTEYFYTII